MTFKTVDLTLTLDTSAYADGDVLADTQEIENVASSASTTRRYVKLVSIEVFDEDDNGTALDVVFLSANNSIGTENAAVSITDTNARDIQAIVNIATSDYKDLGGVQVATKSNIQHILMTTLRKLYVACITRGGTPTYTASGIRLRIGIEY